MRLILICAAIIIGLAGRPTLAASPADGVYTGSTTWAGNGSSRCTGLPEFKVTIRDGAITYGGGDTRVPVTIAPDGSFSAQSGQRYLQGRVVGGQLNATTSGGACNYIWSLKR